MRAGILGQTIYLDANIIIYAVEAGHRWSRALGMLFSAIDTGALRAHTSELTIAEVLTKPIEAGASDLIDLYDRVLAPDGPIHLGALDRALMREAASVQARLGLKVADAIHVATAHRHGCTLFLTQDERLGKRLEGSCRWLELGRLDD